MSFWYVQEAAAYLRAFRRRIAAKRLAALSSWAVTWFADTLQASPRSLQLSTAA
jgi:hypothetical protein